MTESVQRVVGDGLCHQVVSVVYVRKENAKTVKTALEQARFLHKDFRMVPSVSDPTVIAVPVVDAFDSRSHYCQDPWNNWIIDHGLQSCPYSTKVIGKQKLALAAMKTTTTTSTRSLMARAQAIATLTPVQHAVLLTTEKLSGNQKEWDNHKLSPLESLMERIKNLDPTQCPETLELFGDDRTVVISPNALKEGDEFWSLLLSFLLQCATPVDFSQDKDALLFRVQQEFWRQLATVHGSQRVVRRGTIDPNSPIRQSGHRLLFPWQGTGIPETTGPSSPGWIRVTEQGIHQSFDMTRVMFSRGNISEKIRFGKHLVQPGDVILDMYAGIGYYTLPALIHGKARHVVACEWNEHAILALRYNVNDNKVDDRVQIFQGDCRSIVADKGLVDMFDRVSLGLLPSSEGGWETAVTALKFASGGWLHVHGNVPNGEKDTWTFWLCQRLLNICVDLKKPTNWVVLCNHVERVKSFAPTVSHFVADIFVGPGDTSPCALQHGNNRAGIIRAGKYISCPDIVVTPSCALSTEGILSQTWMM